MLANTIAGIGHAFFAASFVPFIIGLANPPLPMIILTLIDSIFFWTLAIVILERKK